ncbi:MAG: pentapeptide repeat-containing protein [Synechococcales bacterium]|nr:pentapeptide repeat-containing protein [Synechococcales bacterium]
MSPNANRSPADPSQASNASNSNASNGHPASGDAIAGNEVPLTNPAIDSPNPGLPGTAAVVTPSASNGDDGQTTGRSPTDSTESPPASPPPSPPPASPMGPTQRSASPNLNQPPGALIITIALGIMFAGFVVQSDWFIIAGAVVSLLASLRIFWAAVGPVLVELVSPRQRSLTMAIIGAIAATIGLLQVARINQQIRPWFAALDWDVVGALGDVFGAFGQILIAILAVYVAWRQYVISKDLTIQQNLITQQQTIDSYFQGISDLVLDAEGLLEDWPQERAIAEGRTAAILSSVDATGKAKIIRFLSRSRLLTPLKRDRHLGRAMLDGMGGYQEDRDFGIRVIDLGVMLAVSNLSGTDLRWTDLSDANLVRANLSHCDLVKANLARAILYGTNLRGADLMGVRLFYGAVEAASPRTRADIPDYQTGVFTGAVVEDADFTGAQRLSEAQRVYLCSWGGPKTRSTIPGGCDGIPDRLGRRS